MTKTDFGFALCQYSLLLLALGVIIGMFLQWAETGWPASRKWWAIPLIITCSTFLVLYAVLMFIAFVRTFRG